MYRIVKSWTGEAVAPLQRLDLLPERVVVPLDKAIHRCAVAPLVEEGAEVGRGAMVAQGDALTVHASVAGFIERSDADAIVVRRGGRAEAEAVRNKTAGPSDAQDLARIARDMGLVGMGGSMFPASIKLAAAQKIHTLIVNAVECEPGIQIDEALLLHDADTVRAGLECVTTALGVARRVLAVKRTSTSHLKPFAESCAADILAMPNRYPGGAEKLIVARLEGRMPPAGRWPVQSGYLVFSVASLWALGRWRVQGEPSILRPLTLAAPLHPVRNLLVPVGTPVSHLIDAYNIEYRPERQMLVTGGLMMGTRATPETPVLKGTNAVFVWPRTARLTRPEEPCILCGACFDACPLKLHPSGMMERIKRGIQSDALEAHLNECFLCGACSAVCPAEIPLAQYFRNAKQGARS